MLIGIDASRAFLKRRTGIEEYSYQVISSLRAPLGDTDVVLYIRSDQSVSFDLPKRWRVKKLRAPRFWTQIRLSLEMLFHPPDVLFVPAHTVPLIHPARNATLLNSQIMRLVRKFFHVFSFCSFEHNVAGGPARTIVTVHGLEYEIFPNGYSLWERLYMRFSIRFSTYVAKRVIAVSENTRRDLVHLYGIPTEKISVVHEGVSTNEEFRISNFESNRNEGTEKLKIESKFKIQNSKFLLFIGRLEERKNIVRIIEAFGILKEKHAIPHELVLAGKPGFGYERIRFKIQGSRFKIHELGYVSEEEKSALLRSADIFLFPTLYEGFGLPILEAQAAGVPVVTSETSSLPEIGGEGALYADPLSASDIAEKTWQVLSSPGLRSDIMQKGYGNVRRFGWARCADAVALVLRG